MFRLDYLSCFLTILSTVLLGKKLWQGWIIAGANSLIICVIGICTAQFGFVPANLFCIGLYANNLWNWRSKPRSSILIDSGSFFKLILEDFTIYGEEGGEPHGLILPRPDLRHSESRNKPSRPLRIGDLTGPASILWTQTSPLRTARTDK